MGARERSFSSVHSKVIKKVVPFSEKHFTSNIVAFEYLYIAVSLRVLILENCEFLCFRHRLFYLQVLDIVAVARNNFNFHSFRYLMPYLIIG
jgi:hypothetical protein